MCTPSVRADPRSGPRPIPTNLEVPRTPWPPAAAEPQASPSGSGPAAAPMAGPLGPPGAAVPVSHRCQVQVVAFPRLDPQAFRPLSEPDLPYGSSSQVVRFQARFGRNARMRCPDVRRSALDPGLLQQGWPPHAQLRRPSRRQRHAPGSPSPARKPAPTSPHTAPRPGPYARGDRSGGRAVVRCDDLRAAAPGQRHVRQRSVLSWRMIKSVGIRVAGRRWRPGAGGPERRAVVHHGVDAWRATGTA